MGTALKSLLIKSFAGGLNVYSNATQVEDSESPDLLNVEFSGIGSVRKRMGYIKLTTSEPNADDKIQGIFSYITDSVREILYVADGTLYKYDGAGGSTAITGGTYSTSADVNGAQIGDRLYLTDGATAVSYYNGTNIVTTGVASAPSFPSQSIVYRNRLYINSTANRDRVYYGGVLTTAGASTNTGDFGGANGGFFGFGLGKEVVGLGKLGTYLYVFLKNGIFRVEQVSSGAGGVYQSATDHLAVNISNAIGCRAPRSIENVGNDIYFLDSTIFSLGEVANYLALRTTNVSAKVAGLFENMSQANIAKAAAIYSSQKESYLLAINVGGAAYNDTVVGFSLPYKSWFKWDAMRVNSWLEYVDSSNVKHLYFGSDDDDAAYVYEAYQGMSDNGAAISAYYYTKEFDSKQFDISKLYQFWSTQFGGVYGNITIAFLVNGVVQDTVTLSSGTGSGVIDGWGTVPFGQFKFGIEKNSPDASATDPGLNNDWKYHDLDGLEGETFQFKFSNAVVDQGFEIKQANTSYMVFGPYKRDSSREV